MCFKLSESKLVCLIHSESKLVCFNLSESKLVGLIHSESKLVCLVCSESKLVCLIYSESKLVCLAVSSNGLALETNEQTLNRTKRFYNILRRSPVLCRDNNN